MTPARRKELTDQAISELKKNPNVREGFLDQLLEESEKEYRKNINRKRIFRHERLTKQEIERSPQRAQVVGGRSRKIQKFKKR